MSQLNIIFMDFLMCTFPSLDKTQTQAISNINTEGES